MVFSSPIASHGDHTVLRLHCGIPAKVVGIGIIRSTNSRVEDTGPAWQKGRYMRPSHFAVVESRVTPQRDSVWVFAPLNDAGHRRAAGSHPRAFRICSALPPADFDCYKSR